jgi:hypothetical protein
LGLYDALGNDHGDHNLPPYHSDCDLLHVSLVGRD